MEYKDFCQKYGLNSRTKAAKAQYEEYQKQKDMNLSGHGGVRDGAGRKAKYGTPTKTIRVPELYADDVKWFVELLVSGEQRGEKELSDMCRKISVSFRPA